MTSKDRKNIGLRNGTSHSDRFVKGNLHIVKKNCLLCGNDKFLETNEHISKCSRCKHNFKGE